MIRFEYQKVFPWISDQDLDRSIREIEATKAIVDALRPLHPVARLQVLRAVCAQHGAAVPEMDVEKAKRLYAEQHGEDDHEDSGKEE